MRLSVVKPLPLIQRSNELPPERAPQKQGARGGGAADHPDTCAVRLVPFLTGRSVGSQARPDHLLSVVTRGHTPAARMRGTEGRAAPSVRRFPQGTRRSSERLAPVGARATVRGDFARPSASAWAPSGTTPCLTKRQSAIISLRATATMPMRRLRPPAAPKCRVNHASSALCGCQRSQPHASWMVTRRSSLRPALLMPWSWHALIAAIRHRNQAGQRAELRGRSRNVRVPNNSALKRVALVSATPRS